jgi:alkylglycerol monooxygenase
MSISEYIQLVTQTPFVIAILFMLFVVEYIYTKINARKYNTKQIFANTGILLAGTVVSQMFILFVLSRKELIAWTIKISPVSQLTESLAVFLLCLILADLLAFSFHYVIHKSSLLWALHSVHHSDQDLNTTTTIRIPVTDFIFSLLAVSILVYIGFPASVEIACAQTIFLHQVLVHSEFLRGVSFGPLSYVFVTPQIHATHHSSNTGEYGKNFGGMFSIWDRMFGTLLETQTKKFGVPELPATYNPIKIHLEPLTLFYKKVISKQ